MQRKIGRHMLFCGLAALPAYHAEALLHQSPLTLWCRCSQPMAWMHAAPSGTRVIKPVPSASRHLCELCDARMQVHSHKMRTCCAMHGMLQPPALAPPHTSVSWVTRASRCRDMGCCISAPVMNMEDEVRSGVSSPASDTVGQHSTAQALVLEDEHGGRGAQRRLVACKQWAVQHSTGTGPGRMNMEEEVRSGVSSPARHKRCSTAEDAGCLVGVQRWEGRDAAGKGQQGGARCARRQAGV